MIIEANFLHTTTIQGIITLSTATQEFKKIKAGLIECYECHTCTQV